MSEEEIIKYFKEVIIWYRENTPDRVYALNNEDIEMLQGLLNLYNKEKEKNKILSIQIIENEKLYDKETARLGNIIQELLEERN
jgi:hypothetical protein